jgi:hypothetical protein
MSVDSEQLSDCIAAIYDATFDPLGWTEALEKTAIFMNATGSTL